MIEFLHYTFFFLISLGILILYPFSIFYGYNVFFGILVLFYFVLQTYYAMMNYRACQNLSLPTDLPSVILLVVGYRENEQYWENCLQSILQLNYSSLHAVVALIDGNEEEDVYMFDIFHRLMMTQEDWYAYCKLCPHQGKRHMLEQGYRYIKENFPDNEYIIVVDSDTIIKPNGVQELVKCIHANPRNACATGSIQIFNRNTFLAKVIHSRYLYAFTIERSAQAYVGVMTCCSGPFSIYRQSCLTEEFLDQFINDTFCGVPVAAGDDRMQTNLLLGRGYYSRQTPFAIAKTETPDQLPRYILQQARWSRSTIRCLVHQVRAIGKHHPYLAITTIYETLFPFLVLLSFFPTFNLVHQTNPWIFYQRLFITVAVLVLRTLILMGFNPNTISQCSYNLFIFPMYFLLLLPVKLYAWSTPWIQNWMTSSRKKIFRHVSMDSILIYVSILVWNVILVLCLYSKFSGYTLYYPTTQHQWGGNKL